MVGAVGIENNAERNLKDLEDMPGSTKTLAPQWPLVFASR
jgi:hypothetical protein